jgi:hypothetical protein
MRILTSTWLRSANAGITMCPFAWMRDSIARRSRCRPACSVPVDLRVALIFRSPRSCVPAPPSYDIRCPMDTDLATEVDLQLAASRSELMPRGREFPPHPPPPPQSERASDEAETQAERSEAFQTRHNGLTERCSCPVTVEHSSMELYLCLPAPQGPETCLTCMADSISRCRAPSEQLSATGLGLCGTLEVPLNS